MLAEIGVELLEQKVVGEKRRVGLIHDCTIYGGLEISLELLARYLDSSRYEPIIIVPGYTDPYKSSPARFIQEVKSLGLPLLRPADPGNSRIMSPIKEIINLANLLRKAKVELVHIHTVKPNGGRKATISARLAGVPVVVRTEHLPPDAIRPNLSRTLLKSFDLLTDQIITVSKANLDEQIDQLRRNPKKLSYVHNGIELERFKSEANVFEAKRLFGLDPHIPLVGAVGRLAEQKGFNYLIESAARVIQEFGPVNFMIVGEGPEETSLKEQVSRLNLQEHFHFTGFASNIVPYVAAMDVATMPSLYEGFGLSLVEFMAMAKPSVVSDLACFRELLQDKVEGLVVEVGNSEALAQSILKLLRDQKLAERMGQAARLKAISSFNIQQSAETMMQLYDTFFQ